MSTKFKTGKIVGRSLYVHRDAVTEIDEETQNLIVKASHYLPSAAAEWNIVRASLEDSEISFLSYPGFDSEPFPVLVASWRVSTDSAAAIAHRNYSRSSNPPILHRKELFLGRHDPRRQEFSKVTNEAEAIGLFVDTSRIGFQREWEQLIERSGYQLVEGSFVPLANSTDEGRAEGSVAGDRSVDRHRTALSRSNLSAPMQALGRFGFLTGKWTIFDYGCGKGDDIRNLRQQGISATGWDPHFDPDAEQIKSDVVNLGFVLNVIEDVAERAEALSRAFGLAGKVLAVAVMTDKVSSIAGAPYRDGYLTTRNTFQKYFSRDAFQELLECTLKRPSVTVAPGVAFVFTTAEEHEAFLVAGQRSSRVWRRAKLFRPERVPNTRTRAQANRVLLDGRVEELQKFWAVLLTLGRSPIIEEVVEHASLIGSVGSITKVVHACLQAYDADEYEAARKERLGDTTVYFALRCLERKESALPLSASLKEDVKSFFGTIAAALSAGRDLLQQIASNDALRLACESAASQGLGAYAEGHSLQVHTSLVEALPPILRVYVGAGAALYGDVRSADLVKIHISSGKLTLLEYDAFDASPIPLLKRRIKINLRLQSIDLFEYGEQYESTILLGKSRFLNEEHADYAEQVAFDDCVSSIDFDFPEHGATASAFAKLLRTRRLEIQGFKLVPATDIPSLDDPCGASFRYRDFIECGETVSVAGIDNRPKVPETYNAIYQLATRIIDPVVDYFGGVRLTFGFCSARLASAIKRLGVGRIAPALDQHACSEYTNKGMAICDRGGAAVDFLVVDEDMYEVAQWIVDHLPFDRLYVYGPDRPIHVSWAPEQSGQITFVDRSSGSVRPRRIKRLIDAPRN
nr:DNA phosphorothioation-associated putative methyltransferase [Caballeronia sp. dw_276]